jgi:hypothetical protein
MPPVTIIATALLMVFFALVAWFVPGWHGARDEKLLRAILMAWCSIFVFKILVAYWLGRNWARQVVLVVSILIFYGLDKSKSVIETGVILAKCVLAVFLLFYLNGKQARTHFGALYQERSNTSSRSEAVL